MEETRSEWFRVEVDPQKPLQQGTLFTQVDDCSAAEYRLECMGL